MEKKPNDYENYALRHNFMLWTDRKSLRTQIKNLVTKAKEFSHDELEARRKNLRRLLDYEDQIYEQEFATKVKSRIDEELKERRDVLLKIREQNTKSAAAFLETKRIQQVMESCYEIREMLRQKERQNVKWCQAEQILEKERKIASERNLDKYWVDVWKKDLERADKNQDSEDCLKRKLVEQTKLVLDLQIEELAKKREQEQLEKQEDGKKIDAILEEIRNEEFERKLLPAPQKMLDYRNDLLQMIEENKLRKRNEECERALEHIKLMSDIKREEEEAKAIEIERKRAFYRETMEYLSYVKRMRSLDQMQEKMRSDRIDDLRRVDVCTKDNIAQEIKRKAKIAEACYAELKRQICEQLERRLREEFERREDKIIENRFAREEESKADLLAKRRKNREDLDKQIEELHRIRKEEEKEYSKNLLRATNDPEFCIQLGEQYMKEGIDYLEPHANWILLACPHKEIVSKNMPPYKECDEFNYENVPKPPCGCELRALQGTMEMVKRRVNPITNEYYALPKDRCFEDY